MTASKDLSIIVADDIELTRTMIKSTLNANNYTDVRLAKNAIEVMESLKERAADVVLADWIMPGIDGLELTKYIRQMDEDNNRYTSVIMVTSKESVESLVEAFDHGVDDYLIKPANDQELTARVYAAGRISILQTTLLETTKVLETKNKQLMELATTDPLTGLGNRRFIDQHLETILATIKTRGGAMACLLIDIDHFKEINDSHGHNIGDEVLISFTKRVRSAIRPTDVFARVGGEEFCVIMYFTEESFCRPVIFERILIAINTRPMRTSVGDITVTASIGVCRYAQHNEETNKDEMISCADQKMYQAKKAGRNNVIY